MFCFNCGTSNREDAKFCVHCNESLFEIQSEESISSAKPLNDRPFLKKFDFVQGLFDLSFTHSVTPKIIKYLYVLSILSAGLMALFFVMIGFKTSMLFGTFALLIGAPLLFLFTLVYSRVLLEMILAFFRIADSMTNTRMSKKEEDSMINFSMLKKEEKSESRDSIQWNI
jgi:hypothetical protein